MKNNDSLVLRRRGSRHLLGLSCFKSSKLNSAGVGVHFCINVTDGFTVYGLLVDCVFIVLSFV